MFSLEWHGLRGLASLALPQEASGPEPDSSALVARNAAGKVFFVAKGIRVALHPLVVYQEDRNERERIGFLNGTVTRRQAVSRGEPIQEVRQCDYLDYNTGDLLKEVDVRRELTLFLARLRGHGITESEMDRIIATSQAEPSEIGSAPRLAGAIIGDFDLKHELGQGGMGVVYRARQRSLNRTVALKVLSPILAADPVGRARFRREIAALARCEHPNLVKILTSGSEGDRHYYAMELVEGVNLADLYEVLSIWRKQTEKPLREGHLPAAVSSSVDAARRRRQSESAADTGASATVGITRDLPLVERIEPGKPPRITDGPGLYVRLAELFASAADAMAHMHSRGVVHRDVKPGNLMLTSDCRRVVIMDLGLAQLQDRSQSLTTQGTRWVGTLRYCSPEQLQSNLLDVDERTDIYGLGATLYELLTLAPLFDGDTEPRLIEQVLRREPRNPLFLDPSIPRDLVAIVQTCLEKDRACRYPKASDLADDLRRYREGHPVAA